jgi:hypothetical protein
MPGHDDPEIVAAMDHKTAMENRRAEEYRARQQAWADNKLLEETREELRAAKRTQETWENWVRGIIVQELNSYTNGVLHDALGQLSDAICGAIGSEIGKLRKEDQRLMTRFVRGEISAALSKWKILLNDEKMRSSQAGNDVVVDLMRKQRTG